MSGGGNAPLAALAPGAPFLLVLALLTLLGVGAHALLVRRMGGERFAVWTERVEGALFALVLAAMLAFSGVQVVLRNLFHAGVLWLDPLVRTLVLWVAFLGAMVATSHGRHLHVDVVHRMLPPRIGVPVSRVLAVICAAVCAVLANAAYIYLREEYAHGVSPFLKVPSWAAQSILLWGFALLSYRFLIQAIWPHHPQAAP